MNNLTQIIHKLEEECYWTAKNIVLHSEADWFKERFELYDLYQTIITILEKIDEGKIEKKLNVIDNEVKKIKYGLTNKGRAIAITNWLGGGE